MGGGRSFLGCAELDPEDEDRSDTEGRDHDPDAARAAVLNRAAEVKAAEEHEELSSASDRTLLDSAEDHFHHGDHRRSTAAYDEYLLRHPEDVVAWNNRGVVFDAMGDHPSAADSYRRAVELQPSYEVAWCNRGNAYTYMGETDEALRNYIQTLRVNRRYRQGYDYLVQLLRSQGEPKDVLKRLQELETELGESAYFKYHQGLLWDELGKPGRALRLYTRALDLEDTDPEIWKAKGNAHFNLEELDLAIECYDAALNLDINNEEVWNNRGFTFFTAGFMGVAIDCYGQAVRINPAYKHAWYNLGYTYHQMDQLEDAITAYERAIEIDDEDEILLNNRGNAEYNLGHYLESIPWFERAVTINPNYDIAWNNIGNALNRSGRDLEAMQYHLRTMEINPKFDYAMYAMGESHHGLHENEKAMEWLDKSLELNPNYDHTWLLKAEVLGELGRPDEALEAVENAIRLNDDFDEAHFQRGELLEELGRPKEARRAYDDALAAVTRSISSRPAQGRMWERKGMMLAQLGEYSEAVRCYDTALLMPRTSMSAREARADVLFRSHRYAEAIDSMRVLEGEEAPDPTDLHLQIAVGLAELGRVDEVREELASLLEDPIEVEEIGADTGEEDLVADLIVDLEDEPSGEVPEAPFEKADADADKDEDGDEKEDKDEKEDEEEGSGKPTIPYVPSYPERREPTKEDRARAWHVLGRTDMVAEDLTAATEHLMRSVSMVPDLPGLQLDMGNVLRETGDIKGALAAFQLAEDHDLDDESPRGLSGVCHLQLGDAKAAERAFDGAIGISPEYALAWLGKGLSLMKRGRNKKAVRYIREALRLDPSFTEARLSLAEAYGRLGKAEEAKREAMRAYHMDQEAEEARRQLEAIGISPPTPPSPVPKAEPEGPVPLTTQPPPVPEEEAQVGPDAPEGSMPKEGLEELPSPGPELDKWFSEHQEQQRPPTDE